MTESVDNIPTLTDIIQVGDQSMLNHFDAHQLNDTLPQDGIDGINEEDIEDIIEASNIIENAVMFDNLKSDVEEIPSIKIDSEQRIDIENEDFSASMQRINDDNYNINSNAIPSKGTQFDNDILKEKINQAVSEVLPEIETQLKEKLYKQFDI